jgi:phosphoribosylformylglycinamidine synthase
LIASAHDCAEGGVAVTIAEACFEPHAVGVEIDLPGAASDGGIDRLAATLFGESAHASSSARSRPTARRCSRRTQRGPAGAADRHDHGAVIRIAVDGHIAIACPLEEAENLWNTALEKWLASRAA